MNDSLEQSFLDPNALSLAAIAALILAPLLAVISVLLIGRIVLTWYPEVDLKKFPVNLAYWPTEWLLALTRKVIPSIGGVDITPIIWFGIFTLVREILLGQQGLLTMLNRV